MIDNLDLEYSGSLSDRYLLLRRDMNAGDFREKMLCYNDVNGMLPLSTTFDEKGKIYSYKISNNISLRELLLERTVTAGLIMTLLGELERIFARGKSYAFEENDFLLHPDTIFFDSDNRILICYVPGYFKPVREQLCDLLEYMLDLTDVNDKISVYAIYSTLMLAREENTTFSLLIDNLKKNCMEHERTNEENSDEEVKLEGNENIGATKVIGKNIGVILGTSLLIVCFIILVVCFILL